MPLSPSIVLKFLLLLIIVCSSAIGILGFLYYEQIQQDPSYETAKIGIAQVTDAEYQKYFARHIDIFFRHEGIDGMIERIIDALIRGQITMFECHSIAHDIGHYGGYPEHFPNIEEYLSKKNLDFCGSGFQHGVEGQLAYLPYPQNVEALETFCMLTMPHDPIYKGCYHGAGHAFMEIAGDPALAMEHCNQLRAEDPEDVKHCYRGVFSEYANVMHRAGNDKHAILRFCATLPDYIKFDCATEVNGLEISNAASEEEIESALHICLDPQYDALVQRGCVHSVAGVASDRQLGSSGEVMPPPYLLTLDSDLQKVYIRSVVGAFSKTQAHTSAYSLDSFCETFAPDESAYCKVLIKD